MLTIAAALAGSNGRQDVFKSWRALIGPVLDLQARVAELEEKNAVLEERVAELEERLDDDVSSEQNIIIQIDEIEYDQGDDVSITGTVEDLVAGEDEVIIQVIGPGGLIESETAELSSDGEFDFVHEVANDANDGLYTARVEYDIWIIYSYFIVNEDPNEIEVEPDDDFYHLGDTVEVVGTVEDVVLGVDEVEVTVLDPNHEDIVDEELVGLDADEFQFEFELSDGLVGRYAIIVTYDNSQQGEAIIEVEEDGGGGSEEFVSAELSKTSYEQGDQVIVTGEIAEDDVDVVEVFVTVDDPSGDEIFDDSVLPESDGSFEFNFDLDDDALTGVYEVTLSYEGYVDEVLAFSVTTGTGSGGLTAKINKTSFLTGESITVTGVVPSIVQDETVAIAIFEPNGTFTGIQAFVEPDSNKEYSVTLKLPTWLEIGDNYRIVIGYDGRDVELEFDITVVSEDASQ